MLYAHHADIRTAADAARALQPFAGASAKYLFAVGIIGAGLLAIPVLAASTAYSVGGLFGWRRSLSRHVNNAPEFYLLCVRERGWSPDFFEHWLADSWKALFLPRPGR